MIKFGIVQENTGVVLNSAGKVVTTITCGPIEIQGLWLSINIINLVIPLNPQEKSPVYWTGQGVKWRHDTKNRRNGTCQRKNVIALRPL